MKECHGLVEKRGSMLPWRWPDIDQKLGNLDTSIDGLDQKLDVRATLPNMIMIIDISSSLQVTRPTLQGRRGRINKILHPPQTAHPRTIHPLQQPRHLLEADS